MNKIISHRALTGIEIEQESTEIATDLTKSGSTRLLVATKHPSITQTRPIVASTHSLTSLTTHSRTIELKIRAPLHGTPPELQILNPLTTLTDLITLFGHCKRLKIGIQGVSIRSEDEREECVDYSEGDQGQEKENEGGETRGFEVVLLPANHWMLEREEKSPDGEFGSNKGR